MEQSENLKATQCRIHGAKFEENFGNEDNTYSSSVVLLMEELETGTMFLSPLSDEDMRELSELDRPLSSKEMVKLSQKLQSWEGTRATLFVNPQHQEITVDMILAEERRLATPIEENKLAADKATTEERKIISTDEDMQPMINLEDADDKPHVEANVPRFRF